MIALFLWTMTASAGCLERPLVPAAFGSEPSEAGCAAARVRMSGRLYTTVPEAGISRGIEVPDSRVQFEASAPGDIGARLAFIPVQTGGATGYVGVAGESWVPAIQIAEARWDWKPAGLAMAAGLVDDPWVAHELRVWGFRPIAAGPGLASAVVERADVGAWVGWTTPERWVSASLELSSGEGWRTRERNNGTNLSGFVVVRPLGGDDALDVALYAREGSKGLLQARDHRAGAAISGGPDAAVFGGSALFGWGLGGDGTLTPSTLSAFARTRSLPVAGWLRVDHTRTVRDDPTTGTTITRAGGGPRLPFTTDGPQPAYLVAGAEHRLPAAGSGPTAGQPRASTTLFLQLTADIGARWALDGS